jgi:hypothetical protein
LVEDRQEGQAHNAGFDSYMTGAVFGSILQELHYRSNKYYRPISKILPWATNRIRISSLPLPLSPHPPPSPPPPLFTVHPLPPLPPMAGQLTPASILHCLYDLGVTGPAVVKIDRLAACATVVLEREEEGERLQMGLAARGGVAVGRAGGCWVLLREVAGEE